MDQPFGCFTKQMIVERGPVNRAKNVKLSAKANYCEKRGFDPGVSVVNQLNRIPLMIGKQ